MRRGAGMMRLLDRAEGVFGKLSEAAAETLRRGIEEGDAGMLAAWAAYERDGDKRALCEAWRALL
jgi:hypothetical protein